MNMRKRLRVYKFHEFAADVANRRGAAIEEKKLNLVEVRCTLNWSLQTPSFIILTNSAMLFIFATYEEYQMFSSENNVRQNETEEPKIESE